MASRPGRPGSPAGLRAGGGPGRRRPLAEALKEMAVKLMLVEGKRGLGLSGRVRSRVDEATKAALLALLDEASDADWSLRGACRSQAP